MAPSVRPSFAAALDRLSDGIDQYKIDFERFLSGALTLAPEDQRLRLVRELRELRNANLRTAVDQFRLGTLEARFNSLCELYQRRVREREEGRGGRLARPVEPSAPRHDALRGVVVSGRLEPDAIDALYEALASRSGGRASLELEAFRSYIARQIEGIRERTGCASVQFRLATEEGKIKLKAKPVAG